MGARRHGRRFIINADDRLGIPPLALVSGGLVVGAATLGVLGLVGLMPLEATTVPVSYPGVELPW